MNDLTQSSFDYGTLPVNTAMEVRAAAERIKVRMKRTVEDIIEIGGELIAVKERLEHGQFLPWIAAEFEMDARTAQSMINVFERFGKNENISYFKPSILYALAAPSTPDAVVEKAIENAESGKKTTTADVKTWKAEYEEEKQRSTEWKEQWKLTRSEKRSLELELAELKSATPQTVQVEPSDYQETKQQILKLQAELQSTQRQQQELVQQQVIAKLKERQDEIDKLERRERLLIERTDQLKSYLESIDSESKRIETHRRVIEEQRLKMVSLSAFLLDETSMDDPETRRLWESLGNMLEEASKAIRLYLTTSQAERPHLRVIEGAQ